MAGVIITFAVIAIITLAAIALIKIIDNFGPACGSAAAVAFIFLCVMIGTTIVIVGIR